MPGISKISAIQKQTEIAVGAISVFGIEIYYL